LIPFRNPYLWLGVQEYRDKYLCLEIPYSREWLPVTERKKHLLESFKNIQTFLAVYLPQNTSSITIHPKGICQGYGQHTFFAHVVATYFWKTQQSKTIDTAPIRKVRDLWY
jgi:hypothetical protein